MDIIDIMLARAMTPQGRTEIYVNKANKAAEKAEKAEADAQAAIDVVTNAAETIAATQEEAATLLETAQEVLETAQQAQINTLDTEDVDAEIKKMTVNTNVIDGQNAKTIQMVSTYPDNTLNTQNITKLYKQTGSNEDGTMTQKAITDVLDTKVESTVLNNYATKVYVTNAIAAIPSGGGGGSSGGSGTGGITFDTDDQGHLVAIDENGNIIASSLTEESLLDTLISSGNYTAKDAAGLDMDYANKVFSRTQQSTSLSMGTDFNKFPMYGGRMKCNVADDGTINAFYGDPTYTEDGSNGQVMVYQPKFYYKRTPSVVEDLNTSKIIRRESLMVSAVKQLGFKLAPIFTGDLDYVLLPAYDGSLSDNKLSSVANVLPLSNITIAQAESYAVARGEGWHIVNMAAESANQMLEIVEFGSPNGQYALGSGISKNPSSSVNCYFITGSTAELGNGSGSANATQVSINGVISTQTEENYRAITYRGMENPWGNLWQMIGGINVYGDGHMKGGMPYICTDFNYVVDSINNNYEPIGFVLPGSGTWINAFGYGNEKYDWVFMPIECSEDANSLFPIGDGLWTTNNLNRVNIVATGGSYGYAEECGPFYYAADRYNNLSSRPNYGVKLMFIPTKNSIYEANIAKWNAHMGG